MQPMPDAPTSSAIDLSNATHAGPATTGVCHDLLLIEIPKHVFMMPPRRVSAGRIIKGLLVQKTVDHSKMITGVLDLSLKPRILKMQIS
jgi:hypothetical protein